MKTATKLLLFFLLCSPALFAQSTTVSGTVTDTGSQTWNSGTYSFSFVAIPNYTQPYSWTGGAFNPLTTYSGTLSGGGAFSVSVPSNSAIAPSGTQWSVKVCPQGSGACYSQLVTISGATQTVNPAPPAISVAPGAANSVYSTAEVAGGQLGSLIYVIGSGLQVCSAVSGGSCSTWTASGGSNAPGTAGPLPEFGNYTFYINSGTVYARNNNTGAIDYSGSDLAVVWNNVTTALGAVGGHLFFKNGVYPINSMTVESTTGCSSFESSGAQVAYALQFPANNPVNTFVEWFIEGEAPPIWMGEAGATSVNTAGVIFNVTSTAVSSVTAGDILAGFWARPITNCTIQASNGSNGIRFVNVGMRFPTNTRGNECAFCMYFTNTVAYTNTLADFALAYNSIATGSAPTVGTWNSIAYTTSASSAGNVMGFEQTYDAGYNLAYDFQSEHIVGHFVTAIYNNYACEFGRSGTSVYHPSELHHFVDQENLNGCVFGPQMLQGSRVDITGLDIERGASNWYARTSADLTETNLGYSSGIITYQVTLAGTGIVAEVPAANLFVAGGSGFTAFEGTTNPNFNILPGKDNFTRANAATLGPAWVAVGTGAVCSFAISSNTAIWGGSAAGICAWVPQSAGNDQVSKLVISADNSSGLGVIARGSVSANTYYDYYCLAGSARAIRKRVAGTFTTLATSGGTACATSAPLELDVIGSSLYAFYNGILDLVATDSSIASGYPGMEIFGASNAASSWSGGGIPAFGGDGTSVSQHPAVFPAYYTLSNCSSSASPAVCGSAASGSVALPTNAVSSSIQVNTTAVTAGSQILVTTDDTLGTKLGVTCNSTVATLVGGLTISARTPGTSFTIANNVAVVTNPLCVSYEIIN